MPNKNLHDKPFDETTITKLQIFEDYAQAWIPTFVMKGYPEICIYDFFAGTGYDTNGIAGSPIRILAKIKEQIKNIFQNKVKIHLHFNEFEPDKKKQNKFALLKEACEAFLEQNKEVKRAIGKINYHNEDFALLFPKCLDEITRLPALVFIDQNGVKYLAFRYLMQLEKIKQTDFLYFLSTSYFWRFGDSKEFKDHLDINMDQAKKDPYTFIHKNILNQLRAKLPIDTNSSLYPFSLKKGANIYGIIFGASHPRAVDKFLSIAWKNNEMNGQANFDLYNDASKAQLTFDFCGTKNLTKIEDFQENLKKSILCGEIKNNIEALNFTYREGHIPPHARECLINLKKNGYIAFDNPSPLVTYENVYKNKRELEYKLIK